MAANTDKAREVASEALRSDAAETREKLATEELGKDFDARYFDLAEANYLLRCYLKA